MISIKTTKNTINAPGINASIQKNKAATESNANPMIATMPNAKALRTQAVVRSKMLIGCMRKAAPKRTGRIVVAFRDLPSIGE